jgi:hypothetical protein
MVSPGPGPSLGRLLRAPAVQALLCQLAAFAPTLLVVFLLARAGANPSYLSAALAQGVFAAKTRGKRPLFMRVIYGGLWGDKVFQAKAKTFDKIPQKEVFRGACPINLGVDLRHISPQFQSLCACLPSQLAMGW